MKFKNLQILKLKTLFILLFATISATLSSCVKGDNDMRSNLAALTVIHASPGLPAIDIYINGLRVNGDSIISYTDTIPYKIVNSGTLGITVKKNISSITYISKNIELEGDKRYSFFVAGKPDAVTYLLTEDNMIAPATGKAKLRFLNLSPDAPALDFKLSTANTLFTGQAFKSYTDFASVDPGDYTIGIYEQGNSTALAQQTLKIEAGQFYSVWAKGLKESADPAIALSMQVVSVK